MLYVIVPITADPPPRLMVALQFIPIVEMTLLGLLSVRILLVVFDDDSPAIVKVVPS